VIDNRSDSGFIFEKFKRVFNENEKISPKKSKHKTNLLIAHQQKIDGTNVHRKLSISQNSISYSLWSHTNLISFPSTLSSSWLSLHYLVQNRKNSPYSSFLYVGCLCLGKKRHVYCTDPPCILTTMLLRPFLGFLQQKQNLSENKISSIILFL